MKRFAMAARRSFSVVFRKIALICLCLALTGGIKFSPWDNNFIAWNEAEACAPCDCVNLQHQITRLEVDIQHGVGTFLTDPEGMAYTTDSVCLPGIGTRGWISYEFCRHRELFTVFYFWREHIMASLAMMTEQLVSSAMNQMFIIGTFFDAQMQLETQQLLQTLSAQAHKDYHPSFGMCEIGTLARSLAASQRRGEYNAYLLSQHLMDRQMRNWTMSSGAGKGLDVIHRWEKFREWFCSPQDNDQELGPRTATPICVPPNIQANRDMDIDYGYMVDYTNTIAVNFSDDVDPPAEHRLFALASNLYGNDVFSYFPETFFTNPENEDEYMFVRSIQAKRSVAQNSFNAIVGMKSESKLQTATDLRPFLERVLDQLDMQASPLQLALHLGQFPSYYTQMEFLTKRLYQRPEFFTDLYDTPVNVERKKAALKAIGLMQNMDLFKSKLRMEMSLAVLTELELFDAQDAVQERINTIGDSGLR